MTSPTPLPADYFRDIYSASANPWELATSEYEREKYRATLDALPQRRFRNGFEVGCAIGILTRDLATRVDHLLAVDIEELALRQAKANCEGIANIEWQRMTIPDMWPERKFDLIVISEILYYFSPGGVARIAEHAARSLQPDGMVVLVHWTHPTDLPLGGDDAVARFMAAAAPKLAPVRQLRTPDYRLDILQPFATNPKRNWNRKG